MKTGMCTNEGDCDTTYVLTNARDFFQNILEGERKIILTNFVFPSFGIPFSISSRYSKWNHRTTYCLETTEAEVVWDMPSFSL